MRRFTYRQYANTCVGQLGVVIGASPTLHYLDPQCVIPSNSVTHAVNRGAFWHPADWFTALDDDWFLPGDADKFNTTRAYAALNRLVTPSWKNRGLCLPVLGPYTPPGRLFSTELKKGLVTGWGPLIAMQWLYFLGVRRIMLVGMDGALGHYGEDREYPFRARHQAMLATVIHGLKAYDTEVYHYGCSPEATLRAAVQGAAGSAWLPEALREPDPSLAPEAPRPDGFRPWEWTDAERRTARQTARAAKRRTRLHDGS